MFGLGDEVVLLIVVLIFVRNKDDNGTENRR